MLAYSFYETDNRIMRYAEALAERGDLVDVIALNDGKSEGYENINNVNVFRIQSRQINEKNKWNYFLKIILFFFKSALIISRKHLKSAYDLVHVHNMPDFEVFAALIPKLTGTKVILDIHDILPEFYASKFSRNQKSIFFKILVAVERLSGRFADHVIISNHLWQKTLVRRSFKSAKCTTLMNYPDENIFYKRPRIRNDERFIIIYPGSFTYHQGLDIAIEAFAKIAQLVPAAEMHFFGSGPEHHNLEKLIKAKSLSSRIIFREEEPLNKIAEIMSNADLGVIPKRNDPFGGEAFSTKILEFMSLGIPTIVSATKIDKFYFNDSLVKFFEPENVDDLSKAMLTMIQNPALRVRLRDHAYRFVEDYLWSKKKSEYFELVDNLIGKNAE